MLHIRDMGSALMILPLPIQISYLFVDRSTGTEKWSNTQLEYRNVTAPLVLLW